jgi:hypothetical protein
MVIDRPTSLCWVGVEVGGGVFWCGYEVSEKAKLVVEAK